MTTMRTATTAAISGFICLNLLADDVENKFFIQRGEKIYTVNNIPKHTVSEPIHKSFVYIAGEYIEPPYIVSVSNLAVCINNRVVNDFASIVFIPSPPLVIPKERPVLPEGINNKTHIDDEHLRKYVQQMFLFLQGENKFDIDQKAEALISIYQSLPNIKTVERDLKDPACLQLTFQNGTTTGTHFQSFSRKPVYNLNNVGMAVDREYKKWVEDLQAGEVIRFFYEGGGSRSSQRIYDGDGGALMYVELAKKAQQGDEKARGELINAFKLGTSMPDHFNPNWIEQLANNTKLETRATAILETKRERERQDRERREQQQEGGKK